MPIYRAIDRSNYNVDTVYYPRSSRRIPSNIPYLVDNLWEWVRPERYPSRRQAAYASPCQDQAKASSISSDSITCEVAFAGEYLIAQHLDVVDAKNHPDVRQLPKFILQLLGSDWPSLAIETRSTEALLWSPGLSQEETQEILMRGRLNVAIDQIFNKVTFWEGVRLVSDIDKLPSTQGEIFFEYKDGYQLFAVEG